MKQVYFDTLAIYIMKYNYLLYIIPYFFMFSCQTKQVPSEYHEKRIQFNKGMSEYLSRNVPAKYQHLLPVLSEVYENDQKYRDIQNAAYLKENEENQKMLDRQNLLIVANIFDTFGYLSIKEIGLIGNKTINLVLNHADLTFKEKYYDLVVQAYAAKKMNSNTYASFMDKYQIQKKKFQLYGTQTIMYKNKMMYYPIDLSTVDSFRNTLYPPLELKSAYGYRKVTNVDSITYLRYLPDLIRIYKIDTIVK